MKVSKRFVLREIAGSYVIVPVGDDVVDFSSMITVNETGAYLWNELQNDVTIDELCEKLLAEYEGVTTAEAKADIVNFVSVLKENGILE